MLTRAAARAATGVVGSAVAPDGLTVDYALIGDGGSNNVRVSIIRQAARAAGCTASEGAPNLG